MAGSSSARAGQCAIGPLEAGVAMELAQVQGLKYVTTKANRLR